MKIINNDFYTNNWQDFVHQWVMKKVDRLVQRYNLPVDVDTIESFRIQTNEVGAHDFVFTYTKDGMEHTLTITTKPGEVEISISDNSTWVVNGEDTGKNTAGQMGLSGDRGPQGITGDKGPQGLKGKTGVQGPRGERGEPGDKGPQGDRGERGPQGLQGEKGLQGERGERGETGPQGEKGLQGKQGLKGETGDKGPQGIAGILTGDKGPTGPTGPKGKTGDKGPTGSKGPQGIIGETGDKGPQGDRGERGPQGDPGPEGLQGLIGDKGEKGDTGHHPDVSIGENEHFYVDGEDTDKPSRGEPGKLTGVNKENYVKQMYNTIGAKLNDACYHDWYLNTSSTQRNWGYLYSTYVSDAGVMWITPYRSDIDNHYDENFSKTYIQYLITTQSIDGKGPFNNNVSRTVFGAMCSKFFTSVASAFNFDSGDYWCVFHGSPWKFKTDVLSGFAIVSSNTQDTMIQSLLSGIIRVTDRNKNVRTFQPCGVTYKKKYGYRFCPVYRPYKKGPQSQWSTSWTSDSSNYDITIEIIDNDGTIVDTSVGYSSPVKHPEEIYNRYLEHRNEME